MRIDAGEREQLLQILAEERYVEGVYADASEGLEPGDEVFIAEFEYDLEED